MADLDEILKDRGQQYGNSVDQFRVAQVLKCTMKQGSWAAMNNSQKEAIEMICTKMSRLVTGDPSKQDTWDDIAGYAKLGNKEAASKAPPLVTTKALLGDVD